jgi:hypothetical protein
MVTVFVWGAAVCAALVAVVVDVRNERARSRLRTCREMTELHRLARCVEARSE